MRRSANASAWRMPLLILMGLCSLSNAASAPRIINQNLAFGVVVSGTVAPLKYAAAAAAPPGPSQPPSESSPSTPAPPPAPVPAAAFCYNVTVDPSILSTVVFWKGKSLHARMQTCSGMPLLRASVYGCPSMDPNARIVWQYMSPAMMSSQTQRAAPLPADWEWQSDSQAMSFELTHQTFYIEVVPHPNATVDSSFQLSTHLFDSTVFPKEKLFPLANTVGWNKTLEQKSLTSTTSSFGADPNEGNIQLLFYLPGDNRRVNNTNSTNSSAPLPASASSTTTRTSSSPIDTDSHRASSRQLFSVKDGVSAPTAILAQSWAELHNDVEQRLSALAAEGIEPHQSDSEFPFNSHARKHARIRDAAASSSFATPGVYWNSPQPARWAVPASEAKYEFLVYVREITQYVDRTFSTLRDDINDLPPALASVTKKLGKEAVPAALKNGNAFTLWSACGLAMTQNALAVPADGNVSRTDGTAMWMKFPSSELQTATDGTGRVSFVMKGLSSERNNAYLVNVAVTNVATGEIATYEVLTIQNETPVYKAPEVSAQDYAVIIGVCVTVFVLVVIFVSATLYYARKKTRPRLLIKRP